MKLYVNIPVSLPNAVARIAADLCNQNIEVIVADEAMRKTPAYKALTTTDKFPLLQTPEGCLHESTAIAKYFCQLAGGKFLGSNAIERSHVDQWIAFNNATLFPSAMVVNMGIFGWGEVTQNDWNEAAKNLKAHVKTLNTHLDGKQWLVGNEMTIADIIVGLQLSHGLQTVLDGGFRKAMKNVEAWATSVFAHASVVKVLGNIQMCQKALKPVCIAEKKEEKKKVEAAPVKKEEKQEEVKVLDNVASLPPSSFDVYNFKTFYVNHADKKGEAVDEWYKMLDWEGWSFWFFHYEKYTGEGEKLHVTNNLMNGFLSRAEHVNKYCFARHGVFGEEPNLEIMGVWLVRGVVIPDGLQKEHPQFEYYKVKKLDPRTVPADDHMIREFFGGNEKVNDIFTSIGNLKCQTLRWVK